MAGLDVTPVRPDSEVAIILLGRYYEELASRFPEGFDVARTVAAPPEELIPPRGVFLVAQIDGVPVGCGGVRTLGEATAEIKRMWVDPTARGRGVGRSLLAALENAAVQLGCQRVRLDTSAHLTEALTLYRSAGYAEIPAYNDNRYAAHWLEKQLGA